MEPTSRKIQALVDMFLDRELLLPEMQRKYVWKATQVRDLIDSVYRDYPSGSILVWETEALPEVKEDSFGKTSQGPLGKVLLLLDGQQRVTSLSSILTGRPIRLREGSRVYEKSVDIYFNLDHPCEDGKLGDGEGPPSFEVGDLVEGRWEDGEFYPGKISAADGKRFYILYEDGDEGWSDEVRDLTAENKKELYFQIKNRGIEGKPNWISVTKLYREGVGAILRDLKIGADDPNFDKYNSRLNRLFIQKESYLYPIQIIRGKSYDEVTDIFIRVNSSGTRLRGSDLALAQITSTWPGAMKLLESFVDDCIGQGFYLDENFLVRCLVCVATQQAKLENIGRVPAATLRENWELTKKGVQRTVNFLKNCAFVDSTALLPSPILLVPLIYYSRSKDVSATTSAENGFLYWLYNAAIWGRYSASMETRLTQDLAAMRESRPWITLTNNIWQVVGKDRRVTPEEIRGKSIGSSLFFMMYVLARKKGARDLETGAVINYSNFGNNNKIEYDHIFPRSKLDRFLKDKFHDAGRKRVINEIANMAFMTRQGNVIKTNEDPADYFPKVYKKWGGEGYFSRQLIPYDEDLLAYGRYEDFLRARAELLACEINQFLNDVKEAVGA